MKTFARKFLSVTLAAMMLLSMLPTVAFAASETEDFLRIYHFDCGRKYFTVDEVKEIIDALAENYYTHLELAFGNDGLRFLLDDMSVTVGETTYSHDDVKAGIQDGNVAYSHSGEWNQDEMDEIMAYADNAGIEIIPLVNTPGHMDAIVDAMASVGIDAYYGSSVRTVDVTNANGVAFTQALIAKYAAYFAEKGCTYFHMGADEYANDAYSSGSMGFGQLISAGQYDEYVSYINGVAQIIKDAGMIPMAFNDGIYFQSNTSNGTFDSDIVITYWSSGWTSYTPATASFLANKGHKIVNTNDGWYYVLGRNSGSTYSLTTARSNVASTPVTDVPGSSDPTSIGAMMCLWCDTPSVSYDSNKSYVLELIETWATSNPDYFTEPQGPEMVEITKNGVTVTAPGLTSLSVTEVEAPEISGANNILAWEIVPETEEDYYTDSAEVVVSVPSDWNTSNMRAFVVNDDDSITKIRGSYASGKYTFTMPHFSVGGIYDVEATAEGVNDTVTSNGTSGVVYVLDTNGVDTDAPYLIVSAGSGTGYALKNNNGSAASQAVTISNSTITIDDTSGLLWTFSGASTGTVKNGNHYVYLGSSSVLNTSTRTLTISNRSNGAYYIYRSNNNSSYLRYYNGSWSRGAAANVYLYKQTSNENWTVDAALQESRINSLTVSNEGYTDESWEAYENALTAAQSKLTAVESTKYTSENAADTAVDELIAVVDALETAKDALEKARVITITYETEDGTVVGTGTMNVTEKATTVTLPTSINGTDGNSYAPVDKTLSVPAGTYEFTVIVQDKAPDDAMKDSTLTVEQWITNIHATTEKNGSAYTFTISSTEANSTEGVAITDYAPERAYWAWSDELYLWKVVRLDADNKQTTDAGDDETGDGTTFSHVRYYNDAWQYKTSAGIWKYFLTDDQAVAYYLQKVAITSEVDTMMKDWGYVPGVGDGAHQVALSVAVVYPDGTMSPSEETVYPDASIMYNWSNADKNIGLIAPVNNGTYTISKLTVTPGVRANGTSATWETTDGVNWSKKLIAGDETPDDTTDDVYWFDEKVCWDIEKNAGTEPMVNGIANSVYWTAVDTAYLVLIYLDTSTNDDNLTVKYVDDANNGSTIYDFQIAVSYENTEDPITFFNGLEQDSDVPTEDGTLTLDDDAFVMNSSDKPQTINKKLSLLSGDIPAQYRTGIYDYVGAEIADNGKTLILHYTLNESKLSPLYVIDFGLPMNFNIADVIENPEQVNEVTIGQANYGTLTRSGNVFTYTPTSVLLDTDVVRLTFKLTNGNSISKNMGFTPASNVLYEDGFMSVGDESSSRYTWKDASKSSTNTSPSGKQTVDQAVQYGYDTAYTGVTGASGTQYTAEVTESKRYTNDLAFTFNGVGFDLIGACEANSGTLMVRLNDANGNYVKAYVVDTAFEDAAYNTIYQVPLIHEQELQSGTYTAVIRGAYITYNAAASSVETLSLFDGSDDTMAQIYDLMYEMGLSEEDLDTVEFISVNDMADEGILLLADDSETDGMSLAIDGFRVYRSTDNSVFMASEKGVTYTNVMAGTAGNIIAYIEGDGNETGDTSYAVSEYEKMGGPQNEIYLQPNTAIAIQLKDKATYAQISARAVGATAANLSDGKDHSYNIAHNTELYYVVTAADDGLLVIGNTSGGLLALGNLKASCGITTINTDSLAAVEEAVLLMMSMPPVSDEPETPVVPEVPVEPIKPNKPSKPDKPNKPNKPGNKKEEMPELNTSFVGGNVFAFPWSNKVLMTVVVTSAEEIDYITINGREITGTGRYVDGSYVYVITDTFDGNGAIEYEVIAYSVTGKASATKVFSVK